MVLKNSVIMAVAAKLEGKEGVLTKKSVYVCMSDSFYSMLCSESQ